MGMNLGLLDDFLKDMKPFFYRRSVSYVDVGAYDGETFRKFADSGLAVREALLVEPNPKMDAKIKNVVSEVSEKITVTVENCAVGAEEGEVKLKSADSMSKVVEKKSNKKSKLVADSSEVVVPCKSLDALSSHLMDGCASILKVDVEGFELEVLKGAKKLLADELIDVIYLEAGASPDGEQQCYYRDLEDFLAGYGYKLFRVYEQMFEWKVDSPVLRRMNMAFMSDKFAKINPFRISNELFDTINEVKLLRKQLTVVSAERENLDRDISLAQKKLEEFSGREESNLARRKELETEIEDMSSRLELLSQEGLDKDENIDQLSHEIDLLKLSISEKESSLVEVKSKEGEIRGKNADLRKTIESKEKALSESERHKSELASKVNELKLKLSAQEKEFSVIESLLKKEVANLQSTHTSLDATYNENILSIKNDLIGKIEVMASNNATLQELRVKLERENVQLIQRSDQLQKNSEELMKSVGSISAEKERITSILEDLKQENESLKSSVHSLEVEFKEYKRKSKEQIQMLRNKVSALKERGGRLEKRVEFLSTRLASRIGEVVVRGFRSPLAFCLLPIELIKACQAYKNQSKAEAIVVQKSSSDVEVVSEENLPFKDYELPAPKGKQLVFQARNILEELGVDAAIEFLEKNGGSQDKKVSRLMYSNKHIDDDKKWLEGVNEYLHQYGMTPIKLRSGSKNRYYRIYSESVRSVEDGPKVSIIMPAFNAEETINLAVRSILDQTWKNLELIVVNDCSSDDTLSILRKMAKKDPRLNVLNNKINVGPYVSKNLALKAATGKYVTGHDADDWAHPERIERHVNSILESDGEVKASLAYMLRVTETGEFSHFGKMTSFSPDGAMRVSSISCMFEKAVLDSNLGFWDSVRFGADSEMIARAKLILGDAFSYVDQIGMICLDAEGGLTNDPNHGICKVNGISDTRKFYKEAFTAWHDQKVKAGEGFMEFPQQTRPFEVLSASEVQYRDVLKNI